VNTNLIQQTTRWEDLQSERLCLRLLRVEDAARIFAYRSLPEVERYQGWEAFTMEDAERLVDNQLQVVPNTPDSWLQLAITTRASGTLIGDCGLHFLGEETQQVEIGITLSPDYQGQGFATEALECVLEYVFGQLKMRRVSTIIDARNCASARLMERVGFRKEAHHLENVWFKGEWVSEIIFAMLRREWEERHSQKSPTAWGRKSAIGPVIKILPKVNHSRARQQALDNASPGDIVLFHHARGMNRIITMVSGSRYYHVGIYAGGTEVIESRVKGVSKRDLTEAKFQLRFRIIPAPGGPEVGRAALQWAEKHLGERYAYFSVFALSLDRLLERFFGPVDIIWRQRARVSCGEFVAQAFEEAGEKIFPGVAPDSIAPWDFARLLRRHAAREK
jgi:RimJ/RimL family protein N-acetyltransferase